MRYKKVFIVSPSDHVTGGPQTLHQLCNIINTQHYSTAYMYYVDERETVMPAYSSYTINVATNIEDDKDNLLIVPEGLTYYLKKYCRINKAIWWLSWDYYIRSDCRYRSKAFLKRKGLPLILSPLLEGYLRFIKREGNIYRFDDHDNIFHFYNCEYAHENLLKNGVNDNQTLYLCGPLSDLYFDQNDSVEKENIVCYNPAKGKEFSQLVIEYFEERESDVVFVALQNMSTQEVCNQLKKSKVYMDFGYFPGPERIPREAVMLDCNIITSLNGSAANNEDIKIPRKYKFLDDKKQLNDIYNCICDLIDNYELNYHCYDEYREKVKKQREAFEKNILFFFS